MKQEFLGRIWYDKCVMEGRENSGSGKHFSRSTRKSMATIANVSSVSVRRGWCWKNNVDTIFI